MRHSGYYSVSNLRNVGEKPRKKVNPQTTGTTEGRVMVKTSSPDEDYSRDDFFRDLKKVAEKQDRSSQPDPKER
jgi:hypothetical protein